MTAPISPPGILGQITPAVADGSRVATRTNVVAAAGLPNSYVNSGAPARKKKGNFLFSEFYPEVNKELNRRKSSDNLARTHMPFGRLTTTIVLPNKGRFFTMGLHGFDNLNPDIESIYEPVGGGNLIGYTYDGGRRIPVYTDEIPSLVANATDVNYTPLAQQGKEYLENEYLVQRNVKKFPPPGITEIQIRRAGLAGALLQADITITAYTLGQLQALQEYMLVPGLHAVLEWGQIASGDDEQVLANSMLDFSNSDDELFLKKLANNEKNRRHIWDEYTKKANCNYDFMVGRISNFSFTLEGTEYKVKIRLSSPGDLISSLTNTETSLPPEINGKDSGVYATAIREYFAYYFENKLAQDLENPALAKHIFLLQTPPKTDKESQDDSDKTVVASPAGDQFGENTKPYYITWAYFINEIIHGSYGTSNNLKYWFVDEGRISTWYSYPQIEKIGGNTGTNDEVVVNPTAWVDTPVEDVDEPKIGCHPYLRSIDPATMIIYNKRRQDTIKSLIDSQDSTDPTVGLYGAIDKCIKNRNFSAGSDAAQEAYEKFKAYGNFDVTSEYGYLSRGIWINHLVIQEAFLSQDTFHDAISHILRKMSAATGDYWNLQLHFNESAAKINVAVPEKETGADARQQVPGGTTAGSNFQIIDARFTDSKKAADELVPNADNIYMFNKRLNSADINSNDFKMKEAASGGELLSFNAEFSLPNILASAIAIKGVKGEGEFTKDGVVQYSTPVQYDAIFSSEFIDILKPFKNVNITSGPTEQQIYPVRGSSAARLMNVTIQGIASQEKKIDEISLNISTKGPDAYQIQRTMGDDLLIVDNTVKRLLSQNPQSKLDNRWYVVKGRIHNAKTPEERSAILAEFLNTDLESYLSTTGTIGDQVANDVILDEYNSKQELKDIRQDVDAIFGGASNVDTQAQILILQLYKNANNLQSPGDRRQELDRIKTAVDEVRKNVTSSGEDDQPKTLTSLQFSNQLQSFIQTNAKTSASAKYYDNIFNATNPILAQQDAASQARQQQVGEAIERLKHYGTVLYYIEPIASYMSRRAYQHGIKVKNGETGQDGSNLFAPAPTRLHVKITLPGISGIHIGDLFWVDRIQPNFYLDGVFTTIGLIETITPDSGWITSIEGVFLFLGRFQFAQYFLGKQPKPATITGPIT